MLFKFSICKLIVYYTCPSSLGIFQFMFASSLLYVTAHGSQEGISFGGLLTICNWNSLEAGVKLTHGFDRSMKAVVKRMFIGLYALKKKRKDSSL